MERAIRGQPFARSGFQSTRAGRRGDWFAVRAGPTPRIHRECVGGEAGTGRERSPSSRYDNEMICPHCDGQIDVMVAHDKKGPTTATEAQVRLAPYLCASCGSLMLFRNGQLVRMGPLILSLIKQNSTLWGMLERKQAEIRALPNRRPVLR